MSSSKRVTNLSSAYDAPADTAPSAVASLASRFDAPPSTTERPAVTEKLSGIASTFGTTVDQDRVPGRSNGGRDIARRPAKDSAPKPDGPPPDAPVVAAANPKVGATAARFDGRLSPEQAAPNAFASAHERFLRFEADARPPADTRVSDMAKVINTASKEQTKAAVAPAMPGKEVKIAPPPPAGRGVGGLAERFERAADEAAVAPPSAASFAEAAKAAAVQEAEKVDQSEGGNNFASAAHRFAEAEKRDHTPAATDPDQPSEDSAHSRFADAARLFGGS